MSAKISKIAFKFQNPKPSTIQRDTVEDEILGCEQKSSTILIKYLKFALIFHDIKEDTTLRLHVVYISLPI